MDDGVRKPPTNKKPIYTIVMNSGLPLFMIKLCVFLFQAVMTHIKNDTKEN